jgi:hypothetical protein
MIKAREGQRVKIHSWVAPHRGEVGTVTRKRWWGLNRMVEVRLDDGGTVEVRVGQLKKLPPVGKLIKEQGLR